MTTTTAKELIAYLKEYPSNTPVVVEGCSCPYTHDILEVSRMDCVRDKRAVDEKYHKAGCAIIRISK